MRAAARRVATARAPEGETKKRAANVSDLLKAERDAACRRHRKIGSTFFTAGDGLTLRRTNEPVCPAGSWFSMPGGSTHRSSCGAGSNTASAPGAFSHGVGVSLREGGTLVEWTRVEGCRWRGGAGPSLRWFRLRRADEPPPPPSSLLASFLPWASLCRRSGEMLTVKEQSLTDVLLSRSSWLYVTGTGLARTTLEFHRCCSSLRGKEAELLEIGYPPCDSYWLVWSLTSRDPALIMPRSHAHWC